jgi:alpha-glucosidase
MWAHGQGEHEPYAHGAQVESQARSFLDLRYRMLPYLYSLDNEANRTGVPMMRSLSLENPKDERSAKNGDEFYLGKGMLVAPVMDKTGGRQVYLPEGTWYDFFGDDKAPHESGTLERQNVPFDRIPVYVRAGTVIPMGPAMEYSNEKPVDPLTINYWSYTQKDLSGGPKNSDFVLYEDDGESRKYKSGEYNQTHLVFEQSQNSIRFSMQKDIGNGKFQAPVHNQIVSVHGARASRVLLGGVEIPGAESDAGVTSAHWSNDGKGGTLVFLPGGTTRDLEIFSSS